MHTGAILGAACVLCLSGCVGDDDADSALSGDYLLDDADGYDPVPGTTIRVSFSDGEISVYAGCNHHNGTFSIEDGVLVVTSLGSTEMGCDAARQAQDEWLADFVTGKPAVQVDGDQVTLTAGDVTLVFLDREVADPDRSLTGRLWTIDTFLSADAMTSFPPVVVPTVTFNDDGSLVIETGCNTGNGSYEATATTLTFSQIAYSRVACVEPGASGIEAQVQEVFAEGTASYQIDAARLTIERDGTGIMAITD